MRTPKNDEDLVSIEEPLEMIVRHKKNNKWVDNSISITTRTSALSATTRKI